MYYITYLSGLCQRRQWPNPLYETFQTGQGYFGCKVRVNNREYSANDPYFSEAHAREGAAMKAYMICRNFSHNDGMYPGQRPGQRSANGPVQGLPVAIGTGRRSSRQACSAVDVQYDSQSSSDATSSGGDSPKSPGGGFAHQLHMVQAVPRASARQDKQLRHDAHTCYCRRGPVRAYGHCVSCLQEGNWA
ncbi:hypothetical protein BAUCODRAFT_121191 [Baudoinia panamericana UAMH 10762]|uniref:DRBM domain-containing protein n=1 Tax=Baudoinia panamericana (strain UAMH 10762) TaxID=717646 RepID=M2NH15_BAUPA|nr:uncharacterized protein BAUCODRAFT_121191 [Baudoinia panamericana UAMH 10762]EMC98315.1 hypothetical protein BAUCODRAFT_121191 [Baudoinia panamericana UAMH 10762]